MGRLRGVPAVRRGARLFDVAIQQVLEEVRVVSCEQFVVSFDPRLDLALLLLGSDLLQLSHEVLNATQLLRIVDLPGKALHGIMVAVENYPQLRATENFQNLERSLNEVEEQISAARRAFNASVTAYNNAVEMFPTNILAGMMGYKRRKVFEITEEERATPSVKSLFTG